MGAKMSRRGVDNGCVLWLNEGMTTSTYAYCDQPHPGSDAEARDWHARYHRAQGPRVACHIPHEDYGTTEAYYTTCGRCGGDRRRPK